MVHRRLVFVLFSAAILVSMVREWSAPVSCALRQIEPGCARRTAVAAVPTKDLVRKGLAPRDLPWKSRNLPLQHALVKR
jgi:hypothetical protein